MEKPATQIKSDNAWLLGALTVGLLVLAWYIATAGGYVRAIFLPSPAATAEALWDLLISGKFIAALGLSFTRVAIASILSVLVGGAIGLLMGVSKKAEAVLNPVVQPLRYLPITALIPLLVLWFGIGESMKIMFLFLGVTFYFIPLVRDAIHTAPQELIDVARSYGAKKWTVVREVFLPFALPRIFDGLIVVNGIGWTYVILAEIINARGGLGYLISIAGRLQKTDEVFAGLILIAFVGIVSDRILRTIRNKYLFW